jgi:hypothetical protein
MLPAPKSAVNLLAALPLLLQWSQHNAGSVTGTFVIGEANYFGKRNGIYA